MARNILEEDNIVIGHGRGTRPLANGIAESLNLPLLDLGISEYEDSEADVPHIEQNLRKKHIIFIGSVPEPPFVKANDVVMDYVYVGDALREAKVDKFSFFIPYLPNLRKDRTKDERTALTSQRVINTIMQVDPWEVMVVEPHEERIKGFFPPNNRPEFLWLTNLFAANLSSALENLGVPPPKVRVIGPDYGSKVRTRQLTGLTRDIYKFPANPHFGIADKDRESPTSTRLLGVSGRGALKDAWIIEPDDIVAGGTTLINPARAVKKRGAKAVFAVAAHAVLTRDKGGIPHILSELNKPDSVIDGLIFSNTFNVPASIKNHPRSWEIDISDYAALAIHHAWGVPYPGRSDLQGSMRGHNSGQTGPIKPQPMPAALQEIVREKLAT